MLGGLLYQMWLVLFASLYCVFGLIGICLQLPNVGNLMWFSIVSPRENKNDISDDEMSDRKSGRCHNYTLHTF